jgi:phosphoribosylformimino-5-aminoimidazole carboxamide ribotide isomerase
LLVIPAVDIRAGRVVRLLRGDYGTETVYGDDPLAMATRLELEGARRLHVVDLDAAFGGGDNRAVVSRLVKGSAIEVQVAGGIRSQADVAAWIATGAAMVVMGTAAIRDPDLLERCAASAPVLAALDVREDRPAVIGWSVAADTTPSDLVARWNRLPLRGVVLTAIDRDGTLEGPDLDLLRRVADASTHPVTYSGGIGSLDDLRGVSREGAAAVIVGKALYEGRFTLAEAVAAA